MDGRTNAAGTRKLSLKPIPLTSSRNAAPEHVVHEKYLRHSTDTHASSAAAPQTGMPQPVTPDIQKPEAPATFQPHPFGSQSIVKPEMPSQGKGIVEKPQKQEAVPQKLSHTDLARKMREAMETTLRQTRLLKEQQESSRSSQSSGKFSKEAKLGGNPTSSRQTVSSLSSIEKVSSSDAKTGSDAPSSAPVGVQKSNQVHQLKLSNPEKFVVETEDQKDMIAAEDEIHDEPVTGLEKPQIGASAYLEKQLLDLKAEQQRDAQWIAENKADFVPQTKKGSSKKVGDLKSKLKYQSLVPLDGVVPIPKIKVKKVQDPAWQQSLKLKPELDALYPTPSLSFSPSLPLCLFTNLLLDCDHLALDNHSLTFRKPFLVKERDVVIKDALPPNPQRVVYPSRLYDSMQHSRQVELCSRPIYVKDLESSV